MTSVQLRVAGWDSLINFKGRVCQTAPLTIYLEAVSDVLNRQSNNHLVQRRELLSQGLFVISSYIEMYGILQFTIRFIQLVKTPVEDDTSSY